MSNININQIVLTVQIVNAILQYEPNKKINNQVVNDGTFRLSRMESIMEFKDYKNALIDDPIQVKKSYDYKNNTEIYIIINGRHRIARAILEDINELPVNIIT